MVIRLPIEEFSAKVREGPPLDEPDDYTFPTWAGVIPLRLAASEPLPDPRLAENVRVPSYAMHYSRKLSDVL
jgi:hypothetical protein